MSNCEEATLAFGVADADSLLRNGWNQGSLFRPNDVVKTLPGSSADPGSAYFVVCSQACVVVSPNIERDPTIEVAVGIPILDYRPRSQQATGEDVRKFHLPVTGSGFQALEVNINSRFSIDRSLLLRFAPDALKADEVACRNFAGWLGRYYTRVALPNELVDRLGRAWFAKLKAFLRASPEGGGGRERASHQTLIHSAYIRWHPDAELTAGRYDVDMMFLARDGAAVEALERGMITLGIDPEARSADEALAVACTVQDRAETFVSDLDGWVRFTHWDHMSGLGEAASAVP